MFDFFIRLTFNVQLLKNFSKEKQPAAETLTLVKSRLRRVMTVVVMGFLILVAYFSVWMYRNSLDQAEFATLNRLAGIVYTLAMQIDGDEHEQLMQRHSRQDDIR